MRLIELLLFHFLLLSWETRALIKTPPTDVPCTTEVDDELSCNNNEAEATDFNQATALSNITNNSSDPPNEEFTEDFRLIGSIDSVREDTSTGIVKNETVDKEIQNPSEVEDLTESPFSLEKSANDGVRNDSLTHEGTTDKILDAIPSFDDNSQPVSQKDDLISTQTSASDPLDTGHSGGGSFKNETNSSVTALDVAHVDRVFPDEQPVDDASQVEQDETISKDEPNNMPPVETLDKVQKGNQKEIILDDRPTHGVILNETYVTDGFKRVSDTESNPTLIGDTPSVSKDVELDTQLERKSTASDETTGELQHNKEHLTNSSLDASILKSIEKGNVPKDEYQNTADHEPRSFDGNQPTDMNLMNEEKVKLDDETAVKENFTMHVHDSMELEDNSNERMGDAVVLDEAHDSSSDDIFVRKCCEDHEFFSLETQHCEDAGEDPKFLIYVQGVLLVNSTKGLKSLNGLLPICPGTTEPPLISEATFNSHTLEAFGHIKDEAYGVKYDHDYYCLELAASNPENLQEATLVLAHCFPTIVKTSVRKCCTEREFFSIISQQCEPSGGDPGFLDAVRERLVSENSTTDLSHITGLLKECPGSGEPPLIKEANVLSHTLLPIGHLKDHYSIVTYDHDHYCLELAAASRQVLADASLVLAYCLPHASENYKAPSIETIVRKCCANNEFFSTRTQECEPTENDTGFQDYVKGIQIDSSTRNLSYVNGKIHWCQNSRDLPNMDTVQSHTHALVSFGHLKELRSGIEYDQDSYCLELGAESPDDLDKALFIAAYCPIFDVQILIRKCCNLNQYFDSDSFECYDRSGNMSNYNNLIHEFLSIDPKLTLTKITVGELRCPKAPPKLVDADETYLDETGQLCEHAHGICHPSSSYCIEHFKTNSDTKLKSGAMVCPTNVFNKCCPVEEIYSDDGCVNPGPNYIHSSSINQIMEILLPHTVSQTVHEETCLKSRIEAKDRDVRWWVDKSGYLSVKAAHGRTTTEFYCIDDYQEKGKDGTDAVAILCLQEMQHVLPVEVLSKYTDEIIIGKCCPHGQYWQDNVCVEDLLVLDLLREPQFVAANVTDLPFTSFPKCQTGEGRLHRFPFGQRTTEDYFTLGTDKTLVVVSMENGCYIREQELHIPRSYCIEYGVDEKSVEPMILLCPNIWEGVYHYQEKHLLTTVLLGISCMALTATAVSLISMRVRRGLVTVKKVNTLAGRILLSYVMSYLLAFLLLAISTPGGKQTGSSYSCSIFAGFLMFFLLAAFQWNTSICLESLLLTLRVSASDRSRYLCHSLWAWGVPGIITTIALTLDHHKESLPCSIIIPRIGLYRCFFSDKIAQILYLYLPMFVSLCANMILLLAARHVRSAKLKRLEKGGRARNTQVDSTEMQSKTGQNTSQEAQQPTAQHSGLRTHQTRNLWTESMKLVVWSGATWMAEVTSFLITRNKVLSMSWYTYLWYLPSTINSLRGIGIFVILVLTPENRHKIFQVVGNFRRWSGSLARYSRSGDSHSRSDNHSSIPQGRSAASRPPRQRNISISTTVSQLSSIRSGTASEASGTTRPETGTIKVHPRIAQSVSQIDTRRWSASSQSSDVSECDSEGAGGRRKSSLANFGLVSLPSVDEDAFEGTSVVPVPQVTPIDATQSTSDA